MTSVEKYQSMLRVDDRPSAGMVTTPVELANEMINRLPVDVFESNSTTFCDPCFGNGTFIIELIKRLRLHGHPMSNIQDRIYGCEIDIGYYNGVNGRKGKLSNYSFNNLHHGDALEYNFNNMKFDVVIGNPPYQENNTDSTNSRDLYVDFYSLSKSLSKRYISLVIPYEWSKRSQSKFRAEVFSSSLVCINIHTARIWHNVKKSTCDILIDKEKVDSVIEINNNVGDQTYAVIDYNTMVFNNTSIVQRPENSLGDIWTRGNTSINELHTDGKNKVIYSLNGRGEPKVLFSDTEVTGINTWKVAVSNLGGVCSIGSVKIIPPGIAHNYSIVSFPVSNEQAAVELKSYLESAKIVDLIKNLKSSTPNSKSIFSYIQMPEGMLADKEH
jgi:hypothetical protein